MIHNLRNVPKRYYIVLLLFLSDMLKAYINGCPVLVIAAITADRKIVLDNETKIIPAEFNWTSTQIGIALGSHAIGPIVSCFGGTIVHRTGGSAFLFTGMLGVAILTLIDPFVMNIHIYLFTVVRFIFGFFEGLTFIGSTDVMIRWTPKNERVRALTIVYLGYGFGAAIAFPLSGLVIHHIGWPYVFYTYGLANLIWCLVWIVFASTDPATNRFVSEKERDYLSKEINISRDEVKVPFRKIFILPSTYALLNDYFVAFILIAFLKFLPLYIKDTLNLDIQLVGLMSSIPPFTSLIAQPIFAYLADYIRNSGYNVGKLHKWFLSLGKSAAIFFYLLTSVVENAIACIICITLAELSLGLSRVSYSALIIDFAGRYAGFIQSLVVVVSSVASFLNPIFIGLLVQNHAQSEWNTYYLCLSLLILESLAVFLIFGSGNLQPWANTIQKEVEKNIDGETDGNNKTNVNCDTCRL